MKAEELLQEVAVEERDGQRAEEAASASAVAVGEGRLQWLKVVSGKNGRYMQREEGHGPSHVPYVYRPTCISTRKRLVLHLGSELCSTWTTCTNLDESQSNGCMQYCTYHAWFILF